MKIKNGELYGATTALGKLTDQDWPVKSSLGIVKLMKTLQDSFDCIEKVRSALVTKYEEEKGKGVSDKNKNWDSFVEEYAELMGEESDVEFEKITLPTKVNGKDIVVKPNVLNILERFVEFKEN